MRMGYQGDIRHLASKSFGVIPKTVQPFAIFGRII